MTEPRRIAVEIMQKILDEKVFFSDAKLGMPEIPPQDSAFINMLVLTALRHLVFIKKTLKKFVKKKLPAAAASGKYALYLGTAEILYLNTPDYAVINSYVEITKKTADKYVGGFVNAVLRKVAEQKEELKKSDSGEFFPPEFFRILNQDYGKKTIQKIQRAAMAEPDLDLSVKNNPQSWADKLGGTLLPNGTIRLKNNGRINMLEGYNEGEWWVQDFAASLAARTLGNIKGLKVLDLCAAPGGKTAQLINAGAEVTSLDISKPRLQKLKENLERLKFNAEIICADALEYLKNISEPAYDAILLDAPCSATGTIRRHPELVHIKRLQDIEKLAALQKDILDVAGNALKKGGSLVYCTCSIAKDEGEKRIEEFIKNHPEFSVKPVNSQEIGRNLEEIITPEGFIRTLPGHLAASGGSDAFFIARLQKGA